jgi:type II secretory pathway component PulC
LFSASGKKTVSQDTKSIVLVGVSMGEKKLAIIRNTKTNKDYYCTEGDIAGDYTIKQILKDKVILESEGNTLELIR